MLSEITKTLEETSDYAHAYGLLFDYCNKLEAQLTLATDALTVLYAVTKKKSIKKYLDAIKELNTDAF